MRIVIDTNVIVSAAIFGQSVSRRCFDRILNHHEPLASTSTLSEAAEVLQRPKLNRYVPLAIRQEFLAAYFRRVTFVHSTTRVSVCRDPKDDQFLELAVDGLATLVVTGDKDLLTLSPFQHIQIVRPDEFLAL